MHGEKLPLLQVYDPLSRTGFSSGEGMAPLSREEYVKVAPFFAGGHPFACDNGLLK